eukprot:gene63691-87111_t
MSVESERHEARSANAELTLIKPSHSHHHVVDGSAQRRRHRGAVAEANDEVRPPTRRQLRRKAAPDLRHFDRLVEEGVADAECRRLQGEALIGAPAGQPVGGIVLRRHEDGEPR